MYLYTLIADGKEVDTSQTIDFDRMTYLNEKDSVKDPFY